ncbi:1615_t:CDS:10 [Funneliformis mosseae]|uniref:1615_t:CDS:1 n=1 Tax=Funneliformis mosseae TaxID=27381 RepID=A0A9N9DGE6_FUNMO|nr:1615_t:CDS:10 [Funneliformis mosseae]
MSYRRKKDSARGNRGSGSDASQRPIGNNRDQVVRNPLDIERENVRILSENFNSSELSYKGSDKIVFIPNEDNMDTNWRRYLKKELTNQHHIRRFLNSCLVTASKETEYKVEELITNLGGPEGRQRLREIVMFPMSVDAGLQPRVASFQRVTLPFLALLTRSGIIDSILEVQINAIFSIVYHNLDDFMQGKVMPMLETLVLRNSLADNNTSQAELLRDDPNSFIPKSIGQFFLVLVRLCNFMLSRLKEAASNETMHNIVRRLENSKNAWQISHQIDSNDPINSNIERKHYFFHILDKEFRNMRQLINNSQRNYPNELNSVDNASRSYKERAQIVDLKRTYDPPGELSEHGPRHNNDFSDITKISIIPTKEEIFSVRPPFLPPNIPGAPHFLPEGPARLLDSQFRLFREDMLSPIRGGITNFLQFLAEKQNNSQIKKFREVGGRYRYNSGQDNGDLYIYPNVRFAGITVDKRRGFSCRIAFTGPKNVGRTKGDRIVYWQRSKKLMNGNLVCLLWPTENTALVNNKNNIPNATQYSLFFGVIVQRDEKLLAKYDDRVEIEINFSDATVYPLALNDISSQKNQNMVKTSRFMVESTGVYLDSYYHILKTMQSTMNSTLPFERYLAPTNEMVVNSVVDLPDYARAPGFHFNLGVLLRDKQKELLLNVSNTNEHENIIKVLKNESIIDSKGNKLDDTQARSLVSSLCKEIALIEGPPGTGKTVIGVEIMKVLLAPTNRNIKLGPILTICFTNHALDQFLEHLIDRAGIDNIVRLGGRSRSDKITPFNLEEIVRNRERPVGIEAYLLAQAYKSLDDIKKDADKIQNRLSQRWLTWNEISPYLSFEFAEHYSKFSYYHDDPEVPKFLLDNDNDMDIDDESSWKTAGSASRNKPVFEQCYGILDNNDEFYYEFDVDDEYVEPIYDSMQSFLLNWSEPTTNRPLEELKDDTNIWNMSEAERITLHDFWRQEFNLECIEDLARLQKTHDEKRKEVENVQNERRKKILKECDVIGMTTHGTAKFQSLIRSIGPKVILCEEAGEVLEAHILSALTPSTQHLILIGDHKQLRPHVATYNLSCESSNGKKYRLDESLFERLVKGNKATRLEQSQLLTQRRMRGEISNLIRSTIYPKLIDGENTTYPNVRGAQHNVYFINHRHSEDKTKSEFAIQSHSNQHEVNMIIEMVRYFVRNGYTKEDDIAVLTPYLGQMMKLRDALKATFTVVIDERDSQDLAEMEDDDDEESPESNVVGNISIATKKSLNQQVTLRTVDNFQGEEANIVIISLVRNSLNESNKGSIGFLKSENRTNVLLSRAKHGMYLLGNAELMANGSPMWSSVVQMLKSSDPPKVGGSFPIVCPQHPKNRNYVSEPIQFSEFAPDGGCLESCGEKLECGHLCPYKCHFDNPDHINIFCRKECIKLHPECLHPCSKFCGEKCGDCSLVIGDIMLPSCGHLYPRAKCYETRNVDSILCHIKVSKTLPNCGHKLEVMCYESVDDIVCKQPCGELTKCEHICSAPCHECQKRSIKANNDEPPLDENGFIIRNTHGSCAKPCERNLFCGHKCEEVCHEGRICKPCKANCTVSCSHSSCKLECFKPCAACAEPCDWCCPHGRCLLSCGAPCSRLPCNLRCEKNLVCGHRCPGICGERCPSPKFCEICAPKDVKDQMIDFIELQSFAEIDWGKERMVILDCGHVFTMDTMDRHMEMMNYYEGSYERWTGFKILSSQSGENKMMTYGRSIKKRILDTQNKKFLMVYDLRLKFQRNALEAAIRNLDNNRPNMLERFKSIRLYSTDNSKKNNIEGPDKIVPEVTIKEQFYQIGKYHSIPEQQTKLWQNHIKDLYKSYNQLTMIMAHTKNPPHKKAFDAALTRLYNEKSKVPIDVFNFENINIADDSVRFEQSLREVGLIAPQLDRRVYIDAFFEIVNAQKIMFHEVVRIISELPNTEVPHSEERQGYISVLATRKNWIGFCGRIIDSITNHLEKIFQTCEESKYGRHLVQASLELVEFEYQVGRFNLNNRMNPQISISEPIKREIIEKCNKIRKDCKKIQRDYLQKINLEYFQGQCEARIVKLLNDVNELQEKAENYGQLTREEKVSIYRAMSSEFSGSGHWYECPNGHPYTIGECGGAMQASRCPDCGAAVGGGSHSLTSGNRRNVEFDTMGGTI